MIIHGTVNNPKYGSGKQFKPLKSLIEKCGKYKVNSPDFIAILDKTNRVEVTLNSIGLPVIYYHNWKSFGLYWRRNDNQKINK